MLLEYAAFGGSLVSAWLYGRAGYSGPVAGLVTAVLFIAYGLTEEIHAAVASNLVFSVVHTRNWFQYRKNDMQVVKAKIAAAVNTVVEEAHRRSTEAGWWDNEDAKTNPLVVPAKLALVHSEVSEALEGHRKGLPDEHLPHRSSTEVELADAVIRIADLAGALGLDLGGAVAEKMEYNAVRPDHTRENRAKLGGKKY